MLPNRIQYLGETAIIPGFEEISSGTVASRLGALQPDDATRTDSTLVATLAGCATIPYGKEMAAKAPKGT